MMDIKGLWQTKTKWYKFNDDHTGRVMLIAPATLLGIYSGNITWYIHKNILTILEDKDKVYSFYIKLDDDQMKLTNLETNHTAIFIKDKEYKD